MKAMLSWPRDFFQKINYKLNMLKYFISDITIWTCLHLKVSGADAYVQLQQALFFANIFEKVANDSCP